MKKHALNESFFEAWTPEMAWALGFMISDGNISSHPRAQGIKYTSCDLDAILKVRAALGSSHPIFRHGNTFNLQFANRRLRESLAALGVTPRKSFTTSLPPCPDDMLPHLIRGLWDGDGSIGVQYDTLRITLTSASQTLNAQFGQVLTSKYGLRFSLIKANPSTWQFVLSGRYALALCYLMYENSTEATRMNRKYATYALYLSHHPHGELLQTLGQIGKAMNILLVRKERRIKRLLRVLPLAASGMRNCEIQKLTGYSAADVCRERKLLTDMGFQVSTGDNYAKGERWEEAPVRDDTRRGRPGPRL